MKIIFYYCKFNFIIKFLLCKNLIIKLNQLLRFKQSLKSKAVKMLELPNLNFVQIWLEKKFNFFSYQGLFAVVSLSN